MYKLMIVDDEEAIRNGIANSINWNEWGYEVTAVLANGEEAVAEIKKDKPHVVLADIRMPKMDGVELMQYLNKNYPEIKIVILSGYNDYEYLNMSIKNQVTEYLLKPTDMDEFEEVFSKMKKRLDQEEEKKREYQDLKKNQMATYLDNLIRGYGFTEEELEDAYLSEASQEYFVVILEADSKYEIKEEAYRIQRRLIKTVEQFDSEKLSGDFFRNYEEKVVGIIRAREGFLDKEDISEYISSLQKKLGESMGMSVSLGVSVVCNDFRMLPQCYEQARCCIRQKQFIGKQSSVVFYEELQEENFRYYAVAFDEERIMTMLLNNKEDEIRSEIHKVMGNFKDKYLKKYWYVDWICQEFLFHISRKLLRYDLRLEELMQEQGKHYQDITQCTSLEEREQFLLEVLERVEQYLLKNRAENKKKNTLALHVRELVDQEYCSNLMSLEYVAMKVKKNAAYISRIFKNEFECNFSDYVTQKRLEYSKELLADPALKVYEIADKTGWADVSNFIKVFKRNCGESPSEYRNRILGKGTNE